MGDAAMLGDVEGDFVLLVIEGVCGQKFRVVFEGVANHFGYFDGHLGDLELVSVFHSSDDSSGYCGRNWGVSVWRERLFGRCLRT